jgi:hypothetical protein
MEKEESVDKKSLVIDNFFFKRGFVYNYDEIFLSPKIILFFVELFEKMNE